MAKKVGFLKKGKKIKIVVQDIEEIIEEWEDIQIEKKPWWKKTLVGRLAGPENSLNGYK